MISFCKVSKQYAKSLWALKDVSFECPQDQITVLLGPSGCGKTTSLRLINQLESLSSGQVFVDGISTELTDAIQSRRQMGYVIQKGGLFPHLNIKENCFLAERVKGRLNQSLESEFERLMDLVCLDSKSLATRHPFELSGGQVQRVSLVRALIGDPKLLLMDEPFGALDPITRKSLQAELKTINQKFKKTIVLVTHDRDEARFLAGHVVLMKEGQVEQQGTWDQLYKNPTSGFVKEFLN